MARWKLQLKNKIEDSNIEEPVRQLEAGSDAELRVLAKSVSHTRYSRADAKLLDQWSTLELSYKIARVSKIAGLDADDDANTQTLAEAQTFSYSAEHRQPNAWENTTSVAFTAAPVKFRPPSAFVRPPLPPPTPSAPKVNQAISNDRKQLDAIIALAQQQAAAAAAAGALAAEAGAGAGAVESSDTAAESSQSGAQRADGPGSAKRAKTSHHSAYGSEEDEAARKEKRMMKLVGGVVVKSMSKYKEMMDHETFKKYARDVSGVWRLGDGDELMRR
jgi:hypothetical protein